MACTGGGGSSSSSSSSSGGGSSSGGSTAPGASDIVNVDELTLEDDDNAAGAAQVGDPARLLALSKQEARRASGDARAVFSMIRDVTQNVSPTRTGTTQAGLAYALWKKEAGGKTTSLVVIKVTENRFRYILAGREGTSGTFTRVLTGIFVKRGENKGAGRFHLDLTNSNELYDRPDRVGKVHFFFANFRDDVKVRRVVNRGVRPASDLTAPPRNYSMDVVFKPGRGGRVRTAVLGDIAPVPGVEAMGLRVLWRHANPDAGVLGGGRADGLLSHVLPAPRAVIGSFHECWDAEGLRTAYADTFPGNDTANPDAGIEADPNEGDTTNCFDFPEDSVPESATSDDAADTDPELDAVLAEGGGDDVTEADADVDPTVTEPALLE